MYKIARISGPKHNYLGLVLTATPPTEVEVRCRIAPEKESCVVEELKLLAAVSEGVQEGNRDTRQSLFVECLEYVPTDTPDYKVYKELARTIIQTASQEAKIPGKPKGITAIL